MANEIKVSFEKETKRDLYFKALDEEIRQLVDPNTRKLSTKFSSIVDCPLCKSNKYKTLFIKRGYTFVRCEDCDLIFTNPMVNPEKLQEYYNQSKANDLWVDVLLSRKNQEHQIAYFEYILDLLEKYGNKGKLLDIGCSIGLSLELAEKRDWEAYGLEIGEKPLKYALCKGLKVKKQLIENCDYEKKSFDTILALGILEHLNTPLKFIEESLDFLKPGGLFVALVPNVYSLASMFLRKNLITFDGRNHLIYYSLETIKKLFEKAGLEVIHLNTRFTAIPNIKKHLQFIDPYAEEDTEKYIPKKALDLFNSGKIEKFILDNDLGINITIIGRYNQK